MKVENIREVKTRFSRYVKELPKSGSVLITKNGRPCAALVPVTDDTDLEALGTCRKTNAFGSSSTKRSNAVKKKVTSIWKISEVSPLR